MEELEETGGITIPGFRPSAGRSTGGSGGGSGSNESDTQAPTGYRGAGNTPTQSPSQVVVDKVDMAAVAVAALVLVVVTTLQHLILFMQDMVVMAVMVFRFLLQDHLQQKLVH